MLADDFVGYEDLVCFIEKRGLQRLDGDIIEIGAYMGGGTVKLARFAQKYGKKVYAIDVFDPRLDETLSAGGVRAGDVYAAFLGGRSMLEVYQEITRGFDNIVTIKGDSKKVRFPEEQKFVFGFVDGCHQAEYVINDFNVIWPHLVSGGVLGLHDYKFDDWPEVTPAIDSLIEEHRGEISEVDELKGKYGILSIMLTRE
ncbi:class I SAM-dependent methyltransferase [Dehalococcoidia bacterium]|nr:class I SAM-dependent methyltransferase [Dehalococcoidia bacterium]